MCYVHLVLEEVHHSTTILMPKDIAMNTSRELPQYFIQRWQLTYMDKSLYLNSKLISYILKIDICREHQLRVKNGDCLQEEAD